MGTNQEKAKQILVPLIRGEITSLNPDQQCVLALWAARAAMAAEFLDPDRIAVPQSHRTWLMNQLEPPDGWFIWIAGYGGVRPDLFQELIGHEIGTLACPLGGYPPGPFRIHSTTIGLAKLIIYIAATDLPNQNFAFAPGTMWPIWPQPRETIHWLPTRLLTDEDVAQLAANVLRNFPLNVPQGWSRPT